MPKRINQFTTLLSAFAISLMCSCASQQNNDAVTSASAYPRVIDRAKKNKNYLVMHSGIDTFFVTSLLVEKNRQDFTVHLSKLDSVNLARLQNHGASGGKVLHLFMKDSISYTLDEPHTIPLNKVARIEKGN